MPWNDNLPFSQRSLKKSFKATAISGEMFAWRASHFYIDSSTANMSTKAPRQKKVISFPAHISHLWPKWGKVWEGFPTWLTEGQVLHTNMQPDACSILTLLVLVQESAVSRSEHRTKHLPKGSPSHLILYFTSCHFFFLKKKYLYTCCSPEHTMWCVIARKW